MRWFWQEPEYPTVNYPTIIEGCVLAPRLRLESLDGSELYMTPEDFGSIGENFYHEGWFYLKDFSPVQINNKWWGVTHLQKESKQGWLKVSPDCYHRWYFWKLQEPGKPGTEQGVYYRKPFSWRWQNDIKKPWIWTKGIIAGHWD